MRRAAVAWSAAVVASCGLLEPDPLAPLVDPGKGPFRDEGAIEVCLGATRVSSRTTGEGGLGLCVAEGDAGQSCGDDAGCVAGGKCVCGRCARELCSDGSDCGGGRLCRSGLCARPCQQDGDCGAGESCSAGGCGKRCASAAECGQGGRCDLLSGLCRVDTCTDDAACGQGRRCSVVERSIELREPAWLPDGALVEGRTGQGAGARSRLYRAAVEAPRRWRLDEAPVHADDEQAGAPAPLVVDGRVEAIYAATPDGRLVRYAPGELHGQPALAASEPWEQGRLGSPSAVVFRGQRLLFYEVGERAGLGVARLDAAGAVVGRAPLLDPSGVEAKGRWEGIEAVGSPDAIVAGDLLLVYFTARGVEGGPAQQGDQTLPADANDSLGLLASDDGERFSAAAGPLVARRANLRTYLGERESAARLVEGGAELLYVASDAAGALAGLGLARSP